MDRRNIKNRDFMAERERRLFNEMMNSLDRMDKNRLLTKEDVRRYFNDMEPVITWVEHIMRRSEGGGIRLDHQVAERIVKHMAIQLLTLEELKGESDELNRAYERRLEIFREFFQALPKSLQGRLLKDERIRHALKLAEARAERVEGGRAEERIGKEERPSRRRRIKGAAKRVAKNAIVFVPKKLGDLVYLKIKEAQIIAMRELKEGLFPDILEMKA